MELFLFSHRKTVKLFFHHPCKHFKFPYTHLVNSWAFHWRGLPLRFGFRGGVAVLWRWPVCGTRSWCVGPGRHPSLGSTDWPCVRPGSCPDRHTCVGETIRNQTMRYSLHRLVNVLYTKLNITKLTCILSWPQAWPFNHTLYNEFIL